MKPEIDDQLIDFYISRFINRPDVWCKQWVGRDGQSHYAFQEPGMNTHGGRFPYEPVTAQLIRRHLAGEVTCAWPAIDEQKCSKWLCFDSDVDDGALDRLEQFLRSSEINARPLREGRRPGRDGHLWLFFDHPVPAQKLIVLGDAMMKFAKVAGLERFPKSATGLSQVRGPFGINLKPEANGAIGWFDVPRQDLREQLVWLETQLQHSAKSAIKTADEHTPKPKPIKKYPGQIATGKKLVNILDLITGYNHVGEEIVTACPICEREGHDRHGDNLHITSDGQMFACWYGGQPGKIHIARDIIQALKDNAARRRKAQL